MRLFIVLAIAVAAWAAGDRPDLSGSWAYDASRSRASDVKSGTLTIGHSDGEVRLREEYSLANGKTESLDVRCNTLGKECTLKDGNEPVRLSMWHNGPKLIVMETRGKRGDVVRKKSLALSEDGNSITLEVIAITPAGEKQVLVFAKK